ncbi:MAG: single-stranded-DNA-specific exonuclease RecJ [Thermodesulfobacteriota bacterium]
MKKRWKVNPVNRELQESLGRELSILPITAQLLINRGLVDKDRAFSFLKPDLNDLHDPFLMKDMVTAVERLSAAVAGGEKIAVFGDYDVDGTTSTALVHLFLKELGADSVTYIPERLKEGYGLNEAAVRELHGSGVKLIVTVDCGVSCHEEVALATTLGVDCIITDHHETTAELPPACAVLDPKRPDCTFPFKGLAGVGVAFNLVMALRTKLRDNGTSFPGGEVPNLKRYLDLVCIGTVADMVPLVDENRVFVSWGLRELENTTRPGLRALKEVSGVKPGKVDTDNIAFQLAPRINAAGRLKSADTALRLFTTGDEVEAGNMAALLQSENSSRQRIEAGILEEALEMAEGETGRSLVLSSPGWHPGVVGIVASRMVGRFTKPTAMIAVEDGIARGSVRGISGINVMEGLDACAALLERYGGHKAAAGFSIAPKNIDGFKKAFGDFWNERLTDEDLVPEVALDAVVSLDEIDMRLVSELERLSPFGLSNRQPLFCAVDTDMVHTEVVKDRHLRVRVKQGGKKAGAAMNGIGFGLASLHPMKGRGFDVAYYPYLDEWRGSKNLKLRIEDVQKRK